MSLFAVCDICGEVELCIQTKEGLVLCDSCYYECEAERDDYYDCDGDCRNCDEWYECI